VDKALTEERDTMLRETESLAKHIEHIKSIVSQQLAAARGDVRGAKIVEQVNVCDLFDDVTDVLKASLKASNDVTIVYEREPLVIGTDRHKVFQIIMNLMTNARDAVATRSGGGTITLRARRMPDERIAVEVVDNGVGIAQDTLARIFSHGFTTKNDGHGFGLHSSACAASELGGSLDARSDGIGCGATFTLLLPSVRPATRSVVPRAQNPIPAESST
jgi:signal transduction histidine kinase